MSEKITLGPCAKVTVKCKITNNGKTFYGENWCRNPQDVCPRKPGEGYDKCHNICKTLGHAEMVALAAAGPDAEGAIVEIEKHRDICGPCYHKLKLAGVKEIRISKLSEEIK